MKTSLLIALNIFLTLLLSAVCIVVFHESLTIFIFSVVALFISIATLISWLLYVAGIAKQSSLILNSNKQPRNFSFSNLPLITENLDSVVKKLNTSANLISTLSFDREVLTSLEAGDQDVITQALHKLKGEMRKIKEAESRRDWINQGLSQFTEILSNRSEQKEYCNKIIASLARYVNAYNGSLFIEFQDENELPYLEFISGYACEKEQASEKKIYSGQGIVGQCMIEKDFIFMDKVPKEYVKVSSGLGASTPRNILIAPLLFNDKFYGVIELAFFEPLKQHEIEFLKKVCENIASEISALKNVQKTTALLSESNELTAQLQTREEEMKHNMEELAATQEEMSSKQTELSGIMNAIDSTLAMVELDTSGKIIKNNFSFEEFLGFNNNQLLQKDFRLLIGNESKISWNDILEEVIKSGDFKTTSKQGDVIWLSITFTPVKDLSQPTQKILCMIQNITQRKNKEKEFERLSLVADNTDNSVIITDRNGLIEYVNEGFSKITGYEVSEVIGKKPGDILQGPLTDKSIIKKLGEQIKAGVPIYEEILNYNKKGETYWVSLAINPVRNASGEVDKLISIQANITDTKIKALDFHQKLTALGKSNAIIEIDMLGNIIQANDNYAELLGYELKDLIGKPYSILTNKENTFQKVLGTISKNGVQSGVFSRYDKNGGRHCMKLMDYPVTNINGDLEKIIEFGVDVSNEKRLEKEAARKQAELNGYLNCVNNTIASAEFTLDGYFKDANEIFLKVMGYHKEELQEKCFEDFLGHEASTIMMWENLKLGKFFSGEFKMKDTQGRELWLTGTFNPISIEDRIPEKIIMLAQFTTQEKEKLNDLQTIVHALKSTLPVLEFNSDFSCKSANEKAMKMFGLTRMNMKSKSILDLMAPYFHPMWSAKKGEILETDFSSISLPFIVGNAQLNYDVTVSIIRSLNGSIAKVVVLLAKEISSPASVLVAV